MPTVASMLAAVPDVIWSGIIGALLALAGVLISNRGNTARLRIQLGHDATEKAKERTAVLRREVYLCVVEELVKANTHLAGMPNLDPSKVNVSEGLQGFFASAARLQLIAEPKTALLVNQLVGEYGEMLIELLAVVQPAHVAKSDIEIADQLYTKAQAEVTRALGEMTKLNESGKPAPEMFRALGNTFDFHQQQSAKFAAARDQAWAEFNAANITFQRMILAKLRQLAPRQIPVLIELRRDLGLSADLEGLEAQMGQQWKRMEARFDALIASLG